MSGIDGGDMSDVQRKIAAALSELIVSLVEMDLRLEIEAIQEIARGPLATQEQRAQAIRACERVISRNQPATNQVAHVNGDTITVVDETALNDAKLEVISCLQKCIGLVQYKVIREKSEVGKYGDGHIIQTRMYRDAEAGGKYQVWDNYKHDKTLTEEEGDLMREETRLKDFSVVATIDDIFADIGDAVETMTDEAAKRACQASFAKTRTDFDAEYKENFEWSVLSAFKKMRVLTEKIYAGVSVQNRAQKAVVEFLNGYAYGGSQPPYPKRAWKASDKAAYLAEYYRKAPVTLKLAKLKRIAEEE